MTRTITRYLWTAAIACLLAFNPLSAGKGLAQEAQPFFRAENHYEGGITLSWDAPATIDWSLNGKVVIYRSATQSPSLDLDDADVSVVLEVYDEDRVFIDDVSLVSGSDYYYSIYGWDGFANAEKDLTDFGIDSADVNITVTYRASAHMIFMQNPTTGQVARWLVNDDGERILGGLVNDTPMGAGFRVAGACDLDGDGDQDLVLENPATGEVIKWLLLTNGSFDSEATINTMEAGYRVAAIGDLDGSGENDLVLENPDTGSVTQWLIDSDGEYDSGNELKSYGPGWRVAGVSSVDFGDTMATIIMENASTGTVMGGVLNNGEVELNTVMNFLQPMSSGWHVVGVGRLDNDGYNDLVLMNTDTGHVSKWLLNWAGTREVGGLIYENPLGPGWQVAGVVDLNRDNTSDIVLVNTDTGLVSKWMVNPSTGERESGGLIHTTPLTPGWEICAIGQEIPET